jgi:hypothetical protein
MKTQQEYAKQLWRLVLSFERRNLGMATDVDVDRARAEFIAAVGDGDRTEIARLAADLEADRILRNTAAEGDVVLSAAEQATFRELLRTNVLNSAALLGLIPPPSKSQLARLDAFLTFRETTKHAAPRVTMPSSSAMH